MTLGPVPRSRPQWVNVITPDAITHFAWGIGDDNPLWTAPADDDRADSPWGVLVAPPCFTYTADETTVAPGHDHLRRVYAGVDWVWFDHMRVGDDLIATSELIDESENDGVITQSGRVEFRSVGRLIATATTTCLRPPGPATEVDDRPELRYRPDQLEGIERTILAEGRRGSERRLPADAVPGSELGPLLKGPLSIMDVVAWCAGTQGVPSAGDNYSEGGLEAQSATGPGVVAWIGQLIGDWMGDTGFLHRLSVTIDELPPLGSTTTITGRVQRSGSDGAAQVEISARDQDGMLTASATAVVMLPTTAEPVELPIPPAPT
jgi:acyl-coenzyme A thioesterase PaaI-like protein